MLKKSQKSSFFRLGKSKTAKMKKIFTRPTDFPSSFDSSEKLEWKNLAIQNSFSLECGTKIKV
jgi:hypothetical protein